MTASHLSEGKSPMFPPVPLALGLGGLVPFAVLALAVATGISLPLIPDADSARVALVGYGVVILSFLGGVRWGIAIGESEGGLAKANRDFVLSVIPALVGWFAWFQPAPADLWWLLGAHVLLGLFDYGLACRVVAPEWYGRLRLMLTAVVAVCLGIAALST